MNNATPATSLNSILSLLGLAEVIDKVLRADRAAALVIEHKGVCAAFCSHRHCLSIPPHVVLRAHSGAALGSGNQRIRAASRRVGHGHRVAVETVLKTAAYTVAAGQGVVAATRRAGHVGRVAQDKGRNETAADIVTPGQIVVAASRGAGHSLGVTREVVV